MEEFSPTAVQLEAARSLARHAVSDFAVARKLALDPDVGDALVVEYVQKAVKEALKSVLMLRGVEFPGTWALTLDFEDDVLLTKLDRDRAVRVAKAAVALCVELLQ